MIADHRNNFLFVSGSLYGNKSSTRLFRPKVERQFFGMPISDSHSQTGSLAAGVPFRDEFDNSGSVTNTRFGKGTDFVVRQFSLFNALGNHHDVGAGKNTIKVSRLERNCSFRIGNAKGGSGMLSNRQQRNFCLCQWCAIKRNSSPNFIRSRTSATKNQATTKQKTKAIGHGVK